MHHDLAQQRQRRFESFPNPDGQALACRVVETNDVVEIVVVELVIQRLKRGLDVRKIQPDLKSALMTAIMDALDAHTTMSTQALHSERIRNGLKDILLGPAELYEGLRSRGQMTSPSAGI